MSKELDRRYKMNFRADSDKIDHFLYKLKQECSSIPHKVGTESISEKYRAFLKERIEDYIWDFDEEELDRFYKSYDRTFTPEEDLAGYRTEVRAEAIADKVSKLKSLLAMDAEIKTLDACSTKTINACKLTAKDSSVERKSNTQDIQLIEQSAEQLAKLAITVETAEQAIDLVKTILNQIESPSEPQVGATQGAIAPEQGWLGRALDTVVSALTTLKNILDNTRAFKFSKKEDLREAISNTDLNSDADVNTNKAVEKPEFSEEQENKAGYFRSGPK